MYCSLAVLCTFWAILTTQTKRIHIRQFCIHNNIHLEFKPLTMARFKQWNVSKAMEWEWYIQSLESPKTMNHPPVFPWIYSIYVIKNGKMVFYSAYFVSQPMAMMIPMYITHDIITVCVQCIALKNKINLNNAPKNTAMHQSILVICVHTCEHCSTFVLFWIEFWLKKQSETRGWIPRINWNAHKELKRTCWI